MKLWPTILVDMYDELNWQRRELEKTTATLKYFGQWKHFSDIGDMKKAEHFKQKMVKVAQ